jgi:hypothetical protein
MDKIEPLASLVNGKWIPNLENEEVKAALAAKRAQMIRPETGAPTKTEPAPVNVPKPQNTPKVQLATGKPTTVVTAAANIPKAQNTSEGLPETGAPTPAVAAPVVDMKPYNTKFQKGESGNPKGRPRGSRNKTTLLREYLLESEVDELIEKVITMAKEGDRHALSLCVGRLVPRCQERTIELKLEPIMQPQQIYAAISTIFQAAGSGQITLSEGEKLVKMVKTQLDAMLLRH